MNNNKVYKIIIAILSFLIIISIVYVIIEKNKNISKEDLNNEPQEEQKILSESNTFDLSSVPCEKENNSCVKELEMTYDKRNHDIKIIYYYNKDDSSSDNYNDYYNTKYDLYVDSKKIDTLEGSTIITSKDEQIKDIDINGNIYVFSGKYLAFLREIKSTNEGYRITFYNNNTRIDNEVILKHEEEELCYDKNCNKKIDVLNNLKFDGTQLEYYQKDCENEKVALYSLEINENSINKKIIKELSKKSATSKNACLQ